MADKNIDQFEKDIERFTKEATQSITPEHRKKECNHVDRLRNKFYNDDLLYEVEEREWIISLRGEESNSEIDDNILGDNEDDTNTQTHDRVMISGGEALLKQFRHFLRLYFFCVLFVFFTL